MKKLKNFIRGCILGIAGLGLVGCATTASQSTITANSVASAMTTLITLDHAAVTYIALPKCGSPGATSICSTPTMVASLKQAELTAFQAVMAAQTAVQNNQSPDMVAVDAALTALDGLTSKP